MSIKDLQDLFTVSHIAGKTHVSKHNASKKGFKHLHGDSRKPIAGKITPSQFRRGGKISKNLGMKLPAAIPAAVVENVLEIDLNSL